jgi:hypothetical protein
MTRPPEGRHPLDPPDLGRHYGDEGERALRESTEHRDQRMDVYSDADRRLLAMQAIGYGLLAIGERLARIGYAANRIHGALERLAPEPVKPEPLDDDVPPPEPVPDPGPDWTPTSGDSGAPRAPDDERWRCGSCQHDTRYAPGAGCRTPELHGIPF